MNKLPTFICIGAAKAGTTWLHACLEEHPDVFMPGRELHFFSKNFSRGFDWYREQYSSSNGEKVIGDISPSYIVHPDSPKRIHEWNPHVQILMVCRNPLQRAYSHYCMMLRGGQATENIEDEFFGKGRFLSEGSYFTHLHRYLEYFPRDQLKVILYDDLKTNARMFLKEVYGFVGVDPLFEPSLLHKRLHVRKTRPRNRSLYNFMVQGANWVSKRSRCTRKFIQWMRVQRTVVDAFHKFNEGDDFPVLTGEVERKLSEIYDEEVEALSKWLDRDLSHWLVTPDTNCPPPR